MSSNAIRLCGWAAVLVIITWIAVFAMVPDGDFENMSTTAYITVAIGSLLMVVAFYGLYLLNREDSPLAGAMLGTSAIGIVLTLIPSESGVIYSVGSLLWGIGIALFGLLVQRASGSRWLAWLSYLAGGLYVLLALVYLAGNQSLGDSLNMVASLPTFLWTGWVAWLMLSGSRRKAAVPA